MSEHRIEWIDKETGEVGHGQWYPESERQFNITFANAMNERTPTVDHRVVRRPDSSQKPLALRCKRE